MKVPTTLRPGTTPIPKSYSAVKRQLHVGFAVVNSFLRRAGVQWRSHAKAHETELQEWDAETYKQWMGMVRRGEGTEAGLGVN